MVENTKLNVLHRNAKIVEVLSSWFFTDATFVNSYMSWEDNLNSETGFFVRKVKFITEGKEFIGTEVVTDRNEKNYSRGKLIISPSLAKQTFENIKKLK